jgi:hypothetical protein
MPFTDVAGKTGEERNPSRVGDAFEKGVHLKVLGEVGPVCPISQADFLSLSQDPIGGVSPSSTEKTSEVTVLCSWHMIQEASCWRGKSELKRRKKSESVRL